MALSSCSFGKRGSDAKYILSVHVKDMPELKIESGYCLLYSDQNVTPYWQKKINMEN